MALGTNRLRPTDFKRHLVARERKAKGRKRSIIVGLSLTSMVDMFSLLVIFLLQTFSASPELLIVAKGVALPEAHSGTAIKDAPVLALSRDEVYLDQKSLGSAAALLK